MKLQVIKQIVKTSNEDEINATLKVLEDISEARKVTSEELDVIGEIMSNLYGALIVTEDIATGTSATDAVNTFMKRVTL
tara:strand:+ start:56 stop:292 length:237 start_codon:yes stop_codon:yes gene_type:complete